MNPLSLLVSRRFATCTLALALFVCRASGADEVFLFSYFIGNGEDGLHLARSEDGLRWTALGNGRSFLTPRVGESKLMRDPCLLLGPDGVFRMVWTTSWAGGTIGYASATDLLQFQIQFFLENQIFLLLNLQLILLY